MSNKQGSSPKNRQRTTSQIGGGLSNLREVDDDSDHEMDKVDLSSKQIKVQSFDLGPNNAARSMVQKRTQSAIGSGIGSGIGGGIGSGIGGGASGIGGGIGGGLRKPT